MVSSESTIYLRNTDDSGFFKFTRMIENLSLYKAYVSEHRKPFCDGIKKIVSFNKVKGVYGIGNCFQYFKTYENIGFIRENGIWKSSEHKKKYISSFAQDTEYLAHIEKNIPWIYDLREIDSEMDDYYKVFVKFPKRRRPYWFLSEPEILKKIKERPHSNPNRTYKIYLITFVNGKKYIGKDFEKNNKYSHYMGSYNRKYVIEDLERCGYPQSEYPIPWANKEILWENELEYDDKTGLHFGMLEDYFIKKYKTNQLEFGYNQTGRKKTII